MAVSRSGSPPVGPPDSNAERGDAGPGLMVRVEAEGGDGVSRARGPFDLLCVICIDTHQLIYPHAYAH